MRAVLLAALLFVSPRAFADEEPDTESPRLVDVKSAFLSSPDLGAIEVRGGCWLSSNACIDTAKELERLSAENAELKKPQPSSWIIPVVIGIVVGFSGGFYVATQVGRANASK